MALSIRERTYRLKSIARTPQGSPLPFNFEVHLYSTHFLPIRFGIRAAPWTPLERTQQEGPFVNGFVAFSKIRAPIADSGSQAQVHHNVVSPVVQQNAIVLRLSAFPRRAH